MGFSLTNSIHLKECLMESISLRGKLISYWCGPTPYCMKKFILHSKLTKLKRQYKKPLKDSPFDSDEPTFSPRIIAGQEFKTPKLKPKSKDRSDKRKSPKGEQQSQSLSRQVRCKILINRSNVMGGTKRQYLSFGR